MIATDYDMAIVGGGIVGITLACALKNSGLNIVLIESQPLEVAAKRTQAYAISLLSGRIFQGLGMWDKISSKIGKFRHIKLSDADYPTIVQFATEDLNTEFLGYVAEHNILLTALQESVAECSNLSWLCPANVLKVDYETDLAYITLKVDDQTRKISTKLVVGADGARSLIRQEVGIASQGWKYWQSCVAFTIKHQAPTNDIAFERFSYCGPMGVLPLPGNRCQIVWTAPHAQAQALLELDESAFLEKLTERTGTLFGELELVSNRLLFPVQLRQSQHYVKSRLALIGDAAHCCHPLGGQGLNLGIRDAAALAQVLQQAIEKKEDVGNINILRRYERWRKPENLVILALTDILNRLFSNRWLPVMILRRGSLWLMCQIPWLRIFFLQLMTGLKGISPQLAQRF